MKILKKSKKLCFLVPRVLGSQCTSSIQCARDIFRAVCVNGVCQCATPYKSACVNGVCQCGNFSKKKKTINYFSNFLQTSFLQFLDVLGINAPKMGTAVSISRTQFAAEGLANALPVSLPMFVVNVFQVL